MEGNLKLKSLKVVGKRLTEVVEIRENLCMVFGTTKIEVTAKNISLVKTSGTLANLDGKPVCDMFVTLQEEHKNNLLFIRFRTAKGHFTLLYKVPELSTLQFETHID